MFIGADLLGSRGQPIPKSMYGVLYSPIPWIQERSLVMKTLESIVQKQKIFGIEFYEENSW